MYSIDELTNYISLKDTPSSWKNCYKDIKKHYNFNWLNNYNFNEILSYYKLDNNFKERVNQEVDLLKQDSKLNIICFIMYYILFLADEKNYYNIWAWKSTENTFKNNGSYMIPVIALLCGFEFHVHNIKQKGFDEEQIELQKHNIKLTCINDKNRFHIDGIRFSQMIWGSLFMKGYLIQVGRLQYEIGVKNFPKLDKYFEEQHKYIYIHIPSGDNLNEKDVVNSLNKVEKLIKKYYPELKNQKLIYYTQSWLLSPEVKEVLSKNSNIMKFQEKFNIVETEENINDFLNFVFDKTAEITDYNTLPEKTILQQALKKKLLKGEKLHLGLGLLKPIKETSKEEKE